MKDNCRQNDTLVVREGGCVFGVACGFPLKKEMDTEMSVNNKPPTGANCNEERNKQAEREREDEEEERRALRETSLWKQLQRHLKTRQQTTAPDSPSQQWQGMNGSKETTGRRETPAFPKKISSFSADLSGKPDKIASFEVRRRVDELHTYCERVSRHLSLPYLSFLSCQNAAEANASHQDRPFFPPSRGD